jgi:hypothetical protein
MENLSTSDATRRRYDRDNDQHVFAIDRLVYELGVPAEEVNKAYREILEEMQKDATVRAFLPILVSMGVKERFTGSCRTSAKTLT